MFCFSSHKSKYNFYFSTPPAFNGKLRREKAKCPNRTRHTLRGSPLGQHFFFLPRQISSGRQLRTLPTEPTLSTSNVVVDRHYPLKLGVHPVLTAEKKKGRDSQNEIILIKTGITFERTRQAIGDTSLRLGPLSTTEGRKSAEPYLTASHHCRPNREKRRREQTTARWLSEQLTYFAVYKRLRVYKLLRVYRLQGPQISESTDFGVHGLRGNISRLRGATGALFESLHMRCDGKECLVEATQEHGISFDHAEQCTYPCTVCRPNKIRMRRIRDMDSKLAISNIPLSSLVLRGNMLGELILPLWKPRISCQCYKRNITIKKRKQKYI